MLGIIGAMEIEVARLKEAMQKVDSLEKLKEQQLEEYKAALIHEEDNELDDIVTSRFNPNQ